jgi:hypothetical protein
VPGSDSIAELLQLGFSEMRDVNLLSGLSSVSEDMKARMVIVSLLRRCKEIMQPSGQQSNLVLVKSRFRISALSRAILIESFVASSFPRYKYQDSANISPRPLPSTTLRFIIN